MDKRHAALYLAIVLVMAACGGGGTTDTTAAAGGESVTTPAPEDPAGSGGGEGTTVTTGVTRTEAPRQSGASGRMTVDGETFEGEVIRCEPFSFGDDPHEDDVSVVLFSTVGLNVDLSYFPTIDIDKGGEYLGASVDLLYSATGGAQFDGGATTDAEGNWFPRTDEFVEDPTPLATAPIIINGDRMTGGMTLAQSWPQGETGTVDLTFDIEIPSEITGC